MKSRLLLFAAFLIIVIPGIIVVNLVDKIKGRKGSTEENKKDNHKENKKSNPKENKKSNPKENKKSNSKENKKNNSKGEFIENDLGKFSVSEVKASNLKIYNGEIEWPDTEEGVEVEMQIYDDEDNTILEKAFDYLRNINKNRTDLDMKIKSYICNDAAEEDGLVHIWGDSESKETPKPISREEFRDELELGGIVIMYEDGELSSYFTFPVDGIFTDHQFDVSLDGDMNITDCEMNG